MTSTSTRDFLAVYSGTQQMKDYYVARLIKTILYTIPLIIILLLVVVMVMVIRI
tara:strand:+ start:421 stop:582 length:162 start_codon:yes stop_codon:yes gene_type:complete